MPYTTYIDLNWAPMLMVMDASHRSYLNHGVGHRATGTQIPDPHFSSFGPSRDYGMDLCLEVYL